MFVFCMAGCSFVHDSFVDIEDCRTVDSLVVDESAAVVEVSEMVIARERLIYGQ